jgi:hypothetical protein
VVKHVTCTVAGCERRHYATGYCNLHYYRARNYGDPGPANPIDRRQRVAAAKPNPMVLPQPVKHLNRASHKSLLRNRTSRRALTSWQAKMALDRIADELEAVIESHFDRGYDARPEEDLARDAVAEAIRRVKRLYRPKEGT